MITMDPKMYQLQDENEIISPSLVYYKDILEENIRRMVEIAGDVKRLWPHVKSHKSAGFMKLILSKGIDQFKCATIAEAEMVAEVGAKRVILAYPLVGPNIARFVKLMKAYPNTEFFAIGDDEGQVQLLSDEAVKNGVKANFLLDINTGLDRTGIKPGPAYDLFKSANAMEGICVRGMHVYDGQRHENDFDDRNGRTKEDVSPVYALKQKVEAEGIDCGIMVMGGTPSFPCHTDEEGSFLSPGTCLIQDYGYATNFPDLEFPIGAMLLTRVVSHPAEGVFTLDLGYKAVAADPALPRAVVAGYEDCIQVMQNEEHLVLKMPAGRENERPAIGTVLYAAPFHICPTSALYPELLVAQNGKIVETWEVTARNRKITI